VLLAKTKEQPFGDLKGLAIALPPRRFRGYSEASVTTIANSLKTHLFDSPKTHTHTFKRESRDCYQSTKINKRRMAALYSTTCRSHSYSLLPSSSSSSSFHGQNHQRLNFSSYIAKRVLPAKVSFHSRRNYHLNVVLMQDG
jgi:hypothetical protein